MVKRNSYVLVLVLVVAIVVVISLFKGGLQGAVVYVSEKLRVPSCVDSDPDNDRYIKGYAQVGVARYQDYCRGNEAYQYECKSSNKAHLTAHPAPCENGCRSGACLR